MTRNAEAGQVVGSGQVVFSIAEDGPRDAVFVRVQQIAEVALALRP